MRHLTLITAACLASLACGDADNGACAAMAGCEKVTRADGTCACTAWEIVESEAVPLPYVVVGVLYRPVGAATTVRYGTTWRDDMVPASASSFGTTVRALVRDAGGATQVAAVGRLPDGTFVSALSPTEVTIARSGGVVTVTTDADLPTSRSDQIDVWTNATVIVRTDYTGAKIVDWTSDARAFWPGVAVGFPQTTTLSPGFLRGEVFWDDAHAAWLGSLTLDARAALLAFDPREDGRSIDFPRYQRLLDATLGPTVRPLDLTWRPCSGAEGFEVLAETVTPMDRGGALVLQYGVQRDAACTPQRPGVLAGTSSAECELGAGVFVDRLAGTLLMTATAPSQGCTPN